MKSSQSADPALASEKLMASFLDSVSSGSRGAREAWLAREAMLSLMRLARSEQLLAIRRSVDKLVPEALVAAELASNRGRRSWFSAGMTEVAHGLKRSQ